jgi:hypothetical protein
VARWEVAIRAAAQAEIAGETTVATIDVRLLAAP